jgi:hypothetical protein
MRDNPDSSSAEATNIPAIGIAAIALDIPLLLLLFGGPLCRFMNANEGI